MRIRGSAVTAALESVALTVWVGGIWIVGYLVAPVLFISLPDPMTAGLIAGRLFWITGYLGLGCGVFLLAAALVRQGLHSLRHWRGQALLVMVAITLVGQFILLPAMQRLKTLAHDRLVAGTPLAREFGHLHVVTSVLFLVCSLLGLALVTGGLRPCTRD